MNARATHNNTMCTPDDACPTAMPGAACYALPTSGATTKRPMGRGVIADTPTDKTNPMGGAMQDCRRPTVRGRGHGS